MRTIAASHLEMSVLVITGMRELSHSIQGWVGLMERRPGRRGADVVIVSD